MRPRVSFVVPVYNAEATVALTVQSILRQTERRIEVLLVDDGSTDASAAVCDELAQLDERVLVVRAPHGGLSWARNQGLAQARGTYVAFIDADDWVEDQTCSTLVDVADDSSADVVIAGYVADTVDFAGQLTTSAPRLPPRSSLRSPGTAPRLSLPLININGYAWNKLYRVAFLRARRLTFEEGTSLVEDVLFNSRALAEAAVVEWVPEIFVHYVQRPSASLGSADRDDYLPLKARALAAHRHVFQAWSLDEQEQQSLMARLADLAFRSFVVSLGEDAVDRDEARRRVVVARSSGAADELWGRVRRSPPTVAAVIRAWAVAKGPLLPAYAWLPGASSSVRRFTATARRR